MSGARMVTLMWVLVLVSALAVIYSSHRCRLAFSELAQLQQDENSMQVVWGQYLLEQSALATLNQIEEKAKSGLSMRVPTLDEIVMVEP